MDGIWSAKVNISIKCVIIILCIGTASFNHARSIIYVLPNAVTGPQCSYNAFSTTFSHQILSNIAMEFDLCWQNCRKGTLFLYASHRVICSLSTKSANRCWCQSCYNVYFTIQQPFWIWQKQWHNKSKSKHCYSLE